MAEEEKNKANEGTEAEETSAASGGGGRKKLILIAAALVAIFATLRGLRVDLRSRMMGHPQMTQRGTEE